MKQTTLVQIAERLEGLAGKLPEKIRRPVLRELTPLKQLFLQQRRPRFLFIGSSKTPMQEIIDLLFAPDSHERMNVTVTPVHRWTEWTIPGHGTISILDARDAGDSAEAQIQDELRREPADIIFFFDDGESNLNEAIDVPQGETKIIGLSLGSARRVTELEQALDAQPGVRDRLLSVVRITERQSAETRRLMSLLAAELPNEAKIEMIRISRDRQAQLHVAQMLIKSTTADLRRNRRATDSAGRPADSHRAASVDGLRNHVHQRPGTKPAGCDRVHRRAGSKRRRGHASSRRDARDAEVFSGVGQRRLRDGRGRGHVCDWSRCHGVLSRRRFPEGGETDVPKEPKKAVASRAAIA